MHFTWDVTFGQIIISIPLFWVIVMLIRMYNILLKFRIEHEDLMIDYAQRKGIVLSELSTRKKWW